MADFDLGELVEFKNKFRLEDLRDCPIDSSIKHIQHAVEKLKKNNDDKDKLRFVIYVKLSKKKGKKPFRGIFFYPTVRAWDLPSEKARLNCFYGFMVIQAQPGLPGIVHQEAKTIAKKADNWDEDDDAEEYELGLSCHVLRDTIQVLNRSTMQYSVQEINENAKYSNFYREVQLVDHESRDEAIVFNPEKIEFTNKRATFYSLIERSTVDEVTRIIIDKMNHFLHNGFTTPQFCEDKETINNFFNQIWNNIRYNRTNFSKNLARTIYIASGFSNEEPQEYWPKIEDKEIISNSIRLAKKNQTTLDLDALPDELDDPRFPELQGVTALMLAAKKACRKSYDLVLMSVNIEDNIDIPTIKEFLRENAKMHMKPILIKQRNEFILYGLSEEGEWKFTDGLDKLKFKNLHFDQYFLEHNQEEGNIFAITLPSSKVPTAVFEEIESKQGHVHQNRDDAYYIVKELVENGADFEKKDKNGKTAKDYALLNPKNQKAQAYLGIISSLCEAIKRKDVQKVNECFENKAINLVCLDKPLRGITLLDLAKQTKHASIIGLVHFEMEMAKELMPFAETNSLIVMEENSQATCDDFKFIFHKIAKFYPTLRELNLFLTYSYAGKNILSHPLGPEKISFIYHFLIETPEFKSFLHSFTDNLSEHIKNRSFDNFIKQIEALLDYKNMGDDNPLKTIGEIFHNPSFLLVSNQLISKHLTNNCYSIVINHSFQSYLNLMSMTDQPTEYALIENKLRLMMHFLGNKENCHDFIDRIVKHVQPLAFSDQFICSLVNLSTTEICSDKDFDNLIKFLINTNGREKTIQHLLNPNTFSHLGFNKISKLLDSLPEIFNHFTEKNINELEIILKQSEENNPEKPKFDHFVRLAKDKNNPKLFSKINDCGLEATKLITLFSNHPNKQTILNYLENNNYRFFDFLCPKNDQTRILDNLTNLLKYITELSKEIMEWRRIKTYWFINCVSSNKNLINQKINLKQEKLKAAEDFLQDLFNQTLEYTIHPINQSKALQLWKSNIQNPSENPRVFQGRLMKNVDNFLQGIEKTESTKHAQTTLKQANYNQ